MDDEEKKLLGSSDAGTPRKPLARLKDEVLHHKVESCALCCGCCHCTCCVLILVLMWLVPGLLGIIFQKLWCEFTSCLNIFNSNRAANCQACKDTFLTDFALTPVGINRMPLGYFVLPLGLIPNFTVYNQFLVRDWESVWNLGSQMPAATWNGTWWRGNELGFVVNNPYFWSGTGIYPASIALGITTKQHAVIRPLLEDAFGSAAPFEDFVRSSIKDFLAHRREAGALEVPNDLQVLVHQILHHVVFNDDLSWEEAEAFVVVQTKMVKLGTVSQFLPGSLYFFEGLGTVMEEVKEYIDRYAALLEKGKWASTLKEANCTPSVNCTVQFASSLYDALYSAGGLSVPGGIATGLGVLFSQSDSNPAVGLTIPPGKELEFFWESIRFFAPVYGFPYWPQRPRCIGLDDEATANLSTEACPKKPENRKGMHPVNQWQGGIREVIFLAHAQKDKHRWGRNASDFIIRNLSDYNNNSVGFAEMAVDKSVDGGRNDRSCPGKDLALLIGRVFFEEMKLDNWTSDAPGDIKLDPNGAVTQVDAFTLRPA